MRYKTKTDVRLRYSKIISDQKEYHETLVRSGLVSGSFYRTELYRALDKKRDRAIYRYENRQRINERARERYRIHKESEQRGNEIPAETLYSGNAIDAFKGRLGRSDMEYLKDIKHEIFIGEIAVVSGTTGEELYYKKYHSISGLFKDLAKWINNLFSRSEGYQIFTTEVTKKTKYDKKTKTLYYSVEIERNEDE